MKNLLIIFCLCAAPFTMSYGNEFYNENQRSKLSAGQIDFINSQYQNILVTSEKINLALQNGDDTNQVGKTSAVTLDKASELVANLEPKSIQELNEITSQIILLNAEMESHLSMLNFNRQ
jgi:hypothetical protein